MWIIILWIEITSSVHLVSEILRGGYPIYPQRCCWIAVNQFLLAALGYGAQLSLAADWDLQAKMATLVPFLSHLLGFGEEFSYFIVCAGGTTSYNCGDMLVTLLLVLWLWFPFSDSHHLLSIKRWQLPEPKSCWYFCFCPAHLFIYTHKS